VGNGREEKNRPVGYTHQCLLLDIGSRVSDEAEVCVLSKLCTTN
jgi:hypothetical protein